MDSKKIHGWGLLLPVALFVIALLIQAGTIMGGDLPFDRGQARETVFFLALMMFVGWSSRLAWLTDRPLVSKLKTFGLLAVMTWGALRLVKVRSHALGGFSGTDGMTLFSLVCAVVLTVWMFLIVRDLIFIQQRKHTRWRFNALLIVIYLYMLYSLVLSRAGSISIPIDRYEEATFPVYTIFMVLLGLFSAVNGFRCKWIHYLDKTQKVGVFFFGAIVYGTILFQFIRWMGPAELSHLILGTWIDAVLLFFIVYVGMALLGILFHLPSAGLMDRRWKEIRVLQSLSSAIGSVLDMEALVSKTAKLSREMVNADFTWLELTDGGAVADADADADAEAVDGVDSDADSTESRIVGTDGATLEDVMSLPGGIRTLLKERVRSEGTLLVNDIVGNKALREMRGWRKRAGSLLAASLRYKQKELGILFAVQAERFAFPEETRDLFQSFADQVAVALENAHLVHKTIEQEVYHEELRLAHEAQMRLLPTMMPDVVGVELDALCMTANEIGGDFYDVIEVSEDRVDIVVGDVSGVGASAAFYMAELKGVISALAPHFDSPKRMLVEINTFMQQHFEADTFATMVYGMYSPSKRRIRLVRAGHPPAGWIRGDEVTWLETEGIGLGLTDDEAFDEQLAEKSLRLKTGDTLFLYTDGLVEARNPLAEEYGEEALREQLQALAGKSAGALTEEIRRSMDLFTQGEAKHDDVTMLTLRIT